MNLLQAGDCFALVFFVCFSFLIGNSVTDGDCLPWESRKLRSSVLTSTFLRVLSTFLLLPFYLMCPLRLSSSSHPQPFLGKVENFTWQTSYRSRMPGVRGNSDVGVATSLRSGPLEQQWPLWATWKDQVFVVLALRSCSSDLFGRAFRIHWLCCQKGL